MNANKLSKRLHCVASYIPEGASIADIGSDHAYLPTYAVKHNIASKAIAGEVAEGPFQSAKKQVEASRLSDYILVRKGNGLSVIEHGEVECVIIAGMGGTLITQILNAGKEKLQGIKRLILQPNIGAINIRKWFLDHNWELIAEEILEEDGKVYEILVAEPGNPRGPYKDMKKELLLGPFLLREKNAAFRKKWKEELYIWKRILNELGSARMTNEIKRKKQETIEKIQIVEEVLQ